MGELFFFFIFKDYKNFHLLIYTLIFFYNMNCKKQYFLCAPHGFKGMGCKYDNWINLIQINSLLSGNTVKQFFRIFSWFGFTNTALFRDIPNGTADLSGIPNGICRLKNKSIPSISFISFILNTELQCKCRVSNACSKEFCSSFEDVPNTTSNKQLRNT